MTPRKKKPAAAPPPMTTFAPDGDFIIDPGNAGGPNHMPMDEACRLVCEELGLPILGGASGAGWSMIATAQTCGELFRVTYDAPGADGRERGSPARPLQTGGLYHVLEALYYGHGLGEKGRCVYHNNGLIREDIWRKHSGIGKVVEIPPTAADDVLERLRAFGDDQLIAQLKGDATFRAPSQAIVLESERCFDKHTEFWGNGREDIEPLAVEWLARHPILGYTCRYDMIARIGPRDGFKGLAGKIVAFERKTAKWLSEPTLEGWPLDGEVLGEMLVWKASGCEKLFGPLDAVIIDIVTKEAKDQKCHRTAYQPHDLPAVANHERNVRYTQAEIALWRAMGAYPQRLVSCFRYGGKCSEWAACNRAAGGDS